MGEPLGDRMKGYERAAKTVLPGRMPAIVRVDGKAFHTYCKGLTRPFDEKFIHAMDGVALALCEEMQCAVFAYVQSDEISVLLHNYKRLATASWFDNEVQKIVSVTASIAGAEMTRRSGDVFGGWMRRAVFDARAFVLPEAEACNYFIWRQQDAARNSIQMVAQSMFSPRELHGKDCRVLQEMIFQESGQNWNDLPTYQKRGRCVRRIVAPGQEHAQWSIDRDPPLFTVDRAYVEQHLAVEPEDPKPVPRFGEETVGA